MPSLISKIPVRRIARILFINFLTLVLLIALVEGFSSITLIIHDNLSGAEITIPSFQGLVRDKELGWTLKKNFFIPDCYGPGQYLKTNSIGLRNDKDFTSNVPSSKVRIICSGDSFTMCPGISNDRTWCHVLSQQNRFFEVANLGVNGYGIDQAYLRFLQVSQHLDYDIHLFAFITNDFQRMTRRSSGYRPKPVLQMEKGVLTASKVSFFTFGVELIKKSFKNSRTISLFTGKAETINRQAETLASHVFDDLQKKANKNNSILVLVHIPVKYDYNNKDSEPWRKFLHKKARENGLLLIDLFEDLRKIPLSELDELFIPQGLTGGLHMSIKGNDFLARALYQRLLELPEIADRLAQKDRVAQAKPLISSVDPGKRTSTQIATGN